MKFILATIFSNIPSGLCCWCSFYLLLNGINGWGWFLVVGVIVTKTVKINNEKESKQWHH
jgi:hypothetical protein